MEFEEKMSENINLDPTLDAIASSGLKKTKQSFAQNLLTGWNAGAWIALGSMLATIVATKVASDWAGFMFAAVFPLGLIGIIIMGGADLFTGDCMITPMAEFTKKVKVNELYRNWFLALGGNLIGSICFAWIVSLSLIYGTGIESAAAAKAIGIAEGKIALVSQDFFGGFMTMVFKGIICNLLVNFAIWQAVKSNTNLMAKVFNIWFPIMAFVAVGSEHVIANMYFIPVGIFSGANVTWMQAFIFNFLPVLTGNMIGGYVFMGLNYWFSTGCNDIEETERIQHSDAARISKVLKQLLPLILGWILLIFVYILVPAGIAALLESSITAYAGYARISFMATPMIGNLMTDFIIPLIIIFYVIGISIVMRIAFQKIDIKF